MYPSYLGRVDKLVLFILEGKVPPGPGAELAPLGSSWLTDLTIEESESWGLSKAPVCSPIHCLQPAPPTQG